MRPPSPPPSTEGFTVVLASTGKSYEIGVGESILDVLLNNGVPCGVILPVGRMQLLRGERVGRRASSHKDCVLRENERASNHVVTICVSGSKSKKLLIDL